MFASRKISHASSAVGSSSAVFFAGAGPPTRSVKLKTPSSIRGLVARWLRKPVRFVRFPRFQKIYFLPAWLLLGVARALILGIPLHKLAATLGERCDPMVPMLDADQQRRAIEIGRVVKLAARYTPWNSNCFAQAILASMWCRARGVPATMFLGLERAGTGQMQAHAWLCAGPVTVTGGLAFERYVPVACFA